ncbi:DUF805 domain-containing protein [Enterobacteriaceae bacterium H11S18]|uniref:DUF805 domain-containing protein n=1 Tax=Enterobacteriaceae TaxID=543 RepID=UPI001925409D|nr:MULTISPECIES: DUF805 domain-containing protein [Enterobacteriaceae]MCT4705430.1 DUF805 domain-containing protein [Dryocola clanedunensis]MCT4710004.1 DUF805 domain-containing protein [Dryocola clanedunensis]
MDWYFKVLRNYVGFRGRARRKEYWMFILVNLVLTGVLSILDKMLGLKIAADEGMLTTIYGLLIMLPSWAVQFRRLHDTDRSAWWLLLVLIPIIGWIVILIFNCQNGTPGENRFGSDPKLMDATLVSD